MQNIQMTIDENLLPEVDELVKILNTTRSAFIRDSLKQAIKKHKLSEMKRQHAKGYKEYPVEAREFDFWYEEQVWNEEK